MLFKSILASLTGFSSDRSVLDTTVALARPGAAHIDCLHTRIDVSQTADFMAGIARKDQMLGDSLRKIGEEECMRSKHAEEAFRDACQRHALPGADRPEAATGISASWREAVTLEDETLAQARYHDITVMGRDRELSLEGIQTVLMRSGRPLLLAPATAITTLGRHVAIAWKDTPEAARAVTAAMPVLQSAKSVTIVCVSDSHAKVAADRQSCERLAQQLAWHSIGAETHVEDRTDLSEADMLRSFCYAGGTDLLVMGAYGHSRARELVFGGMTQDILTDSGVPVFMFH
jgi:nucleotide-binding universal stress UspA family protein